MKSTMTVKHSVRMAGLGGLALAIFVVAAGAVPPTIRDTVSDRSGKRTFGGARSPATLCADDGDCNDHDPCTTDVCQDANCVFTPIPKCVPECEVHLDCADQDECTLDVCIDGLCDHRPIDGCVPPCQSDADCEDDNGCTDDVCQDGTCLSTDVPDCVSCDPRLVCPPLELVVVADTSGSMKDESSVLCERMQQLVSDLDVLGIQVTPHVLGITESPDLGFSCLNNDVVALLGGDVPGDSESCPFPDQFSSYESWGPATAIVAQNFNWTPGSVRIIVPISDEGPCDGSLPGGCNDPGDDRDAINNAVAIALANNVIVSPIAGTGSDACVINLAAILAGGTGGTSFTTLSPSEDLMGGLQGILSAACQNVTPCDDGNACTNDTCTVGGTCDNSPEHDPSTECCNPADGVLTAIDDGNACTNDACDAQTGQVSHPPADQGTSCDDGDDCTTQDVCDGQGLCGGSPVICSDNNACTDDTCQNGECVNTNNFDDAVSCCNPQDGTTVSIDDGDPCTNDTCDPETGQVSHPPADQGTSCDDGDDCTTGDVCNGQGLCGGTPVNCGDDNACTDDSCQNGQCVNTNNYDDAVSCCNPQGGTTVPIEDEDPCTIDTCDAQTGQVNHTPAENGSACDDGDDCTDDTCQGGLCVGTMNYDYLIFCCNPDGGQLAAIDDGNECTRDRCDVLTGFVSHSPADAGIACDDGNLCTNPDMCDGLGSCVGIAISCNDNIACTADSCDGDTGACVHTPNHGSCNNALYCDGEEICDLSSGCVDGPDPDCNDGIGCTTDTCDEVNDACAHTPDDGSCGNGLFCDGEEICNLNVGCIDGPDPDCDDLIDCTIDSCDEENDSCAHAPNHGSCSNGLFCDGEEICDLVNGCVDGPDPDCGDNIGCTVDTCDEENDTCIHSPNHASCSNELYCDGEEICDPLDGCIDGSDPDCNDQIDCTTDTCDEVNDTCAHTPVHGSCSNNLYCDGEEICNLNVGCIDGPDPDCDDLIDCTIDTCDEENDTCIHTPDHNACSNGLYCDGDEVCDPIEGCVDGPDPNCDDSVGCTDDSCDEDNNTCLHTPNHGSCSNGVYCDGDEVCDSVNDCIDGPDPECDDGNACTDDICDVASDVCVYEPNYDGQVYCCDPLDGTLTFIDDDNQCTTDHCNSQTGEVFYESVADGTLCDDVEACADTECRNGVCVALGELALEVVTHDGLDAGCRMIGRELIVNVVIGFFDPQQITGGQFVIPYDPSILEFVDARPGVAYDPESPFSLQIFQNIDEVQGLIVYAVGTELDRAPTAGPAVMATFRFNTLVACAEIDLCFVSENPLNTLLSDEQGQSVPYISCCTGPLRINEGPPVLECPESVAVNPSPGQLSALVTWDVLEPVDGCDGSATLECSAVHSSGLNIDGLIATGGVFPSGLAEFECTATDSCGSSTTCSWSVFVSNTNTLSVDVQLSPTMVAGPLYRCIEFEFYSSCVEPPQQAQTQLRFGLPFDLPGHVKNVEFKIPAGQYFCATARDPLHTLRAVAGIDAVGGKYIAVFKGDPFFGGNWLAGGNLDGSHVIDVLDAAFIIENEGLVVDPDTPCGTPLPHPDLNGDGIVDLADMAFIDANYLETDKNSCCPDGRAAAPEPVLDISIDALEEMGLGHLRVADLNGDGRLNEVDITLYMSGVRPTQE